MQPCWTLPHSLFLSICQSCNMQSNSSVNQEIYVLASSKSGSPLSSSPWVSSASDVILPETKQVRQSLSSRQSL
ncbi:hypothetical protein D4764_20G0001450 [Takifugu flavidus]|uniref:Uncharacterized protein n=1 Tax=Takifugu flavidus TaxID=433684 RepID=A0A5C6NG09_9TELE|nr:hypothetical protein D4764_20G0001450 [Takifugu flavidus]